MVTEPSNNVSPVQFWNASTPSKPGTNSSSRFILLAPLVTSISGALALCAMSNTVSSSVLN
eukprot:CAMPEP_0171101060 /NCGR_PEP_ID=MMETSP0766_2-20121228/53880_1 /TAXON_ID=439317 /ORGANISM="Gambierdiscus australes, Strain CAWD 149" /LENGTH=60 /DNA_ID=CAMNT_0011561015 /DNA_START=1 /DNA_END=180 /DNA_ORIENTATION=-